MTEPIIGLTGPTGAGKSTVAALLRKNGCAVVDADILAREVTERGDCLSQLQDAFGADIVGKDSRLDRRLLAQRAFATHENAARLNAITHPAILAESSRRIAEARKSGVKAVVLDAALLFESGADRLCDTTVAVTAPDEVRLKRIMARDGIPEDLARARMKNQHGAAYYEERAAYRFDGTAGWEALPEMAGDLLRRILEDLHAKG